VYGPARNPAPDPLGGTPVRGSRGPMLGIIQDWLSLLFRWAHVIAGIGWIGSSFYFMALDASLKRRAHSPEGVTGENWSVHGGGP